MEKDRGSRVIAIIALCVAVVGLSVGFAAFTKDLNITFSESNVKVSGELDIKFLASADPNDTNTIINGKAGDAGIIVNPATINGDGTTISGIGFTFDNDKHMVNYDFYIYNNGEYDAYLKSVDFLNYTGAETNKICTALKGTNQSLVDDACEFILIGVGADFNGDSTVSLTSEILFNETIIDDTSIKIPKGEILLGQIAILYVGDNVILPNGDFKINFGDIKFNFSSLE